MGGEPLSPASSGFASHTRPRTDSHRHAEGTIRPMGGACAWQRERPAQGQALLSELTLPMPGVLLNEDALTPRSRMRPGGHERRAH